MERCTGATKNISSMSSGACRRFALYPPSTMNATFMNYSSHSGYCKCRPARWGHCVAVAALVVGCQSVIAQSTLKIAGTQGAVATPSPPAATNRIEQATLRAAAAADDNEVYVFSFVPQPTAASAANVPNMTLGLAPTTTTAQMSTGSGDLFAILVRAGREGETAPPPTPAASVDKPAPSVATESPAILIPLPNMTSADVCERRV